MDADNSRQPLLCIIDEVLRGTNTVERIAASSELLKQIASENILCIAATHDIELCSMLSEQYSMLHFKETVTSDGDVLFDYMIRDGQTTTRNAIKLLKSMGFDKNLVKQANEKADFFITEGKWKL
jgi:DNA mismatch repair ATPase MutS